MIHRFRMACWDPSLTRLETRTYECDDSRPRLVGGGFICIVVDGPRRVGEEVVIHNDMIVEYIGKTHREDGGPSRPGCHCDYCESRRGQEERWATAAARRGG